MIIKLLRYLASFGDQKNRLYREINEMRRLTQAVRKDLIPLENDEIVNISTFRFMGQNPFFLLQFLTKRLEQSLKSPLGKREIKSPLFIPMIMKWHLSIQLAV